MAYIPPLLKKPLDYPLEAPLTYPLRPLLNYPIARGSLTTPFTTALAQKKAQPQGALFDYDDPYEINSIADVILTTFRKDMKTEYKGLPIINILPRYAEYVSRGFVKPVMNNQWDKALINWFTGFSETVDVPANIVKSVLQGKNPIDALGWGSQGRVNFDWNTGSLAADLVLEVLSDPGTYMSGGVSVIGGIIKKTGGKSLMTSLTDVLKPVLKELTAELGESSTKTLLKKIVKAAMNDVVEAGGKGWGKEALQAAIRQLPQTRAVQKLSQETYDSVIQILKSEIDTIIKKTDMGVLAGLSSAVRTYDKVDVALTGAGVFGSMGITPMYYGVKAVKKIENYVHNQTMAKYLPYAREGMYSFSDAETLLLVDRKTTESLYKANRYLTGWGVEPPAATNLLRNSAYVDYTRFREMLPTLKGKTADEIDAVIRKHFFDWHGIDAKTGREAFDSYIATVENVNKNFVENAFADVEAGYRSIREQLQQLSDYADQQHTLKGAREFNDKLTSLEDLLTKELKEDSLGFAGTLKTAAETIYNKIDEAEALVRKEHGIKKAVEIMRETVESLLVVLENHGYAQIDSLRKLLVGSIDAHLQNKGTVDALPALFEGVFRRFFKNDASVLDILSNLTEATTDAAELAQLNKVAQLWTDPVGSWRLPVEDLFKQTLSYTALVEETNRRVLNKTVETITPRLKALKGALEETAEALQDADTVKRLGLEDHVDKAAELLVLAEELEDVEAIAKILLETPEVLYDAFAEVEAIVGNLRKATVDKIDGLKQRPVISIYKDLSDIAMENKFQENIIQAIAKAQVENIIIDDVSLETAKQGFQKVNTEIDKWLDLYGLDDAAINKGEYEKSPLIEKLLSSGKKNVPKEKLRVVDGELIKVTETATAGLDRDEVTSAVMRLHYAIDEFKNFDLTKKTALEYNKVYNNLQKSFNDFNILAERSKVFRDEEIFYGLLSYHKTLESYKLIDAKTKTPITITAFDDVTEYREYLEDMQRKILSGEYVSTTRKPVRQTISEADRLRKGIDDTQEDIEFLTGLRERFVAKRLSVRDYDRRIKALEDKLEQAQHMLRSAPEEPQLLGALAQNLKHLGGTDEELHALENVHKQLQNVSPVKIEDRFIDPTVKSTLYSIKLEQSRVALMIYNSGVVRNIEQAFTTDSDSVFYKTIRSLMNSKDENVSQHARELYDRIQASIAFKEHFLNRVMQSPDLTDAAKSAFISVFQSPDFTAMSAERFSSTFRNQFQDIKLRVTNFLQGRKYDKEYNNEAWVKAFNEKAKKAKLPEIDEKLLHGSGPDSYLQTRILKEELGIDLKGADVMADIETTGFESGVRQMSEFSTTDASGNVTTYRLILDENDPIGQASTGAMRTKFPDMDDLEDVRKAYYGPSKGKVDGQIEVVPFEMAGETVNETIVWVDSEHKLLGHIQNKYREIANNYGNVYFNNGDNFDVPFQLDRMNYYGVPTEPLQRVDIHDTFSMRKAQDGMPTLSAMEEREMQTILESFMAQRAYAIRHGSADGVAAPRLIENFNTRLIYNMSTLSDLLKEANKNPSSAIYDTAGALSTATEFERMLSEYTQELREGLFKGTLSKINQDLEAITFSKEWLASDDAKELFGNVFIGALKGQSDYAGQLQALRAIAPDVPPQKLRDFINSGIAQTAEAVRKEADVLNGNIIKLQSEIETLGNSIPFVSKADKRSGLLNTLAVKESQLEDLVKHQDTLYKRVDAINATKLASTEDISFTVGKHSAGVSYRGKTELFSRQDGLIPEDVLKTLLGVKSLDNVVEVDDYLRVANMSKILYGATDDIPMFGYRKEFVTEELAEWFAFSKTKNYSEKALRRYYKHSKIMQRQLNGVKNPGRIVAHADDIKATLVNLQRQIELNPALSHFSEGIADFQVTDDAIKNYIMLKHIEFNLKKTKEILPDGTVVYRKPNMLVLDAAGNPTGKFVLYEDFIPRKLSSFLQDDGALFAKPLPGTTTTYTEKQLAITLDEGFGNAESWDALIYDLEQGIVQLDQMGTALDLSETARPSYQRLSTNSRHTVKLLQSVRRFTEGKPFKVRANITKAFARVQDNVNTQVLVNVLESFKTPEDVLGFLAWHGGVITYSTKEFGVRGYQNIHATIQAGTKNLMSQKKALEALGVTVETIDDRVFVYLNKAAKLDVMFDSVTDAKKIYVNGKLLERKLLPKLDLQRTFEKVGMEIPDEIFEEFVNVHRVTAEMTNGSSTGSGLELMSKEKFLDIYKNLPEAVRNNMTDVATLSSKDYYSDTLFNFVNLGRHEFREVIQPQIPRSFIPAYVNTTRSVIQHGDKELQYINMILNGDTVINKGFLGDAANDAVILRQLRERSYEFTLGALVKDDKAKRGYKLVQLQPTDSAGLAQARRLNAAILPVQLFSKMVNVINDTGYNKGFLKYWARLCTTYKIGMLAAPGTWMRNYIDSTLKTMIETESFIGAFKAQIEARKKLKHYDQAVYQIVALRDLDLNKLRALATSNGKTIEEVLQDITLTVAETKAKTFEVLINASELYNLYNIAETEIKMMDPTHLLKQDYVDFYFKYMNKNPNFSKADFDMLYQFITDSASAGETPAMKAIAKAHNLKAGKETAPWQSFVGIMGKTLTPMYEIEQIVRLAHHMQNINNGLSFTASTASLTKTHFDYDLKTSIDRAIELVVPFYSFKMKNLEYWMNTLEEHPWVARMYENIMTPIWDFDSYDQYELENNRSLQYQITSGNIPLFGTNMTLKVNPSLNDVWEILGNPLGAAESSILTPLKSVFDMILQRDSGSTPGFLGEGGGSGIASLVPFVGPLAQRLLEAGPRYYGRTGNVLNLIAPSIFGATNRYKPYKPWRYTPRKYAKKKSSWRNFPKRWRNFPKRARRIYPKRFNTYFKRYYGNNYTRKIYDRIQRNYTRTSYFNPTYARPNFYHNVRFKKPTNSFYKYYTKSGKRRMDTLLSPTTTKNLKWKIRQLYHYYK